MRQNTQDRAAQDARSASQAPQAPTATVRFRDYHPRTKFDGGTLEVVGAVVVSTKDITKDDFEAALHNASATLDDMAFEALRDRKEGRTRRTPL